MEIGDYVRTLEYIRKIRKIKDNYVYCDIGVFCFNEIIKSSANIIDLIEVGDYINGSYIYSVVEENKNTGQPRVLFTEEDGVLGNGDIKSIVTKEQFESMEYKVGDKE